MPGVAGRQQTAEWAGRSRVSEDAVELSYPYSLALTLSELCHKEEVSFFCFVTFLFSVNEEVNLILIDISTH